MPQPQPLALTPALPSELLTYILTHQIHPTTLLICQSRTTFLSSLQQCIQRQPPLHNDRSSIPIADQEPNTGVEKERYIQADHEREEQIETEKDEAEAETERQQTQRHPLLIPTLHQIVTSRSVNLVFVPTLSHLRAYLAVFSGKGEGEVEGHPKQKRQFEKVGKRIPLLVVYGLVAMHRDTSEWSAQGVGCSVAALVEAGRRGGRGVVVLEEREWEEGGGDGDGEGRESKRMTGWEERLPMLNGSVKRIGLESEDGGWSGRTVEVGRVLGRWFRFERGEWDQLE